MAMKRIDAIFKDRKGFTRFETIDYPPMPVYYFAVMPSISISIKISAVPSMEACTKAEFRLREIEADRAYYEEV